MQHSLVSHPDGGIVKQYQGLPTWISSLLRALHEQNGAPLLRIAEQRRGGPQSSRSRPFLVVQMRVNSSTSYKLRHRARTFPDRSALDPLQCERDRLAGFGVLDVDSLALDRLDRRRSKGAQRIGSKKNCIAHRDGAAKPTLVDHRG